jgi:hypothetical protein
LKLERELQKYRKKIRLFGDYDTSPEAWLKWRIELEEVIHDYPLKSGEQKASMVQIYYQNWELKLISIPNG